MGKLHDKLKAIGYEGHDLEVFLVRLVFCMFADDTTIFGKNIFQEFIERYTKKDGSDVAGQLATLFDVLNKHPKDRLKISTNHLHNSLMSTANYSKNAEYR